MNSSTNPQDDNNGGFWSFMKSVVEISAELLVSAVLDEEQEGQESKVGKSLIFKFRDDTSSECNFQYSTTDQRIWLENESQVMTCSCTFASVGNDGQPRTERLIVGPGSKQDVTSLIDTYKNGTCGLCAYLPPSDAVGGSFKLSPWIQGLAVGTPLVLTLGAGYVLTLVIQTVNALVQNKTGGNISLKGNITQEATSFEFEANIPPSKEAGDPGQTIPFPNDVILGEGEIIASLMLEISTEDVSSVGRAASGSVIDDGFGPYFLKYVGAHCNPEMVLTAARDRVLIMPLDSSNENQQWMLMPVFVNSGQKFYGFRIALQSDPLNSCLRFDENKQPLNVGAYGHGSPDFVWLIAPSQNNPEAVLIEPYSQVGNVCMDVQNGSCDSGTVVKAWDRNDNGSQQWQFST